MTQLDEKALEAALGDLFGVERDFAQEVIEAYEAARLEATVLWARKLADESWLYSQLFQGDPPRCHRGEVLGLASFREVRPSPPTGEPG